ncbi:MAG TPA: TetR/AcrR family transcriptional regulator [Acidobacteriota bacterium]|jgi:AcrR family transcriptional regulator
MARPTRTRQQRRSLRTRQKLLDAARQVFSEKGLDLTRIDDITERADLGKGTFYYHFESKEKLIRELIRTMLQDLAAEVDKSCSGIVELQPFIDAMIKAHVGFFSERWEDFVLYYQGRADLTLLEGYTGIDAPFLTYLEAIESLLSRVIGHRLPPAALRRIACAVAGFVSGYYSFAVIATQDDDIGAAFEPLRGAMVASLSRFITTAVAAEAVAS